MIPKVFGLYDSAWLGHHSSAELGYMRLSHIASCLVVYHMYVVVADFFLIFSCKEDIRGKLLVAPVCTDCRRKGLSRFDCGGPQWDAWMRSSVEFGV